MTTENLHTSDHFDELASTPYQHHGQLYTYYNDTPREFTIFEFEGEQYFLEGDDQVYVASYNEETGPQFIPVTDPRIVEGVICQLNKDKGIASARDKLSETLASGEPLLATVMRIHMEYGHGVIDTHPMEKDGIKFYSVGRNASIDFYLGVKDGKMYCCAIDPWYGSYDYYDALERGELDEEDIDNDGCYIHEVDPDNIGYIGHF